MALIQKKAEDNSNNGELFTGSQEKWRRDGHWSGLPFTALTDTFLCLPRLVLPLCQRWLEVPQTR